MTKKQQLKAKNVTLKNIDPVVIEAIREIIYMARRYADGRKTFAIPTFNDSYDVLCDYFGQDKIDRIDDSHVCKGFPYAVDGMFQEGKSIYGNHLKRKYTPKENSVDFIMSKEEINK